MDRVAAERAKLVDTLVAAINRGDVEAVQACITPDAEFRSYLAAIEGRVYVGHDGIRAYFEDLTDSFEHAQWRVVSIEEGSGERILVTFEFHAIGRGSGVELMRDLWNVWTIRSGLIALNEVFTEREPAALAAGIAS